MRELASGEPAFREPALRESAYREPALREMTFRVMTAEVHVILVDPAPGAEGYAWRRLGELERRWSRFLPDSDVSRLNTSPEAIMIVSPDTIELLATMQHAWRLTGGRYDPTLLTAINAVGYWTSRDGSGRTSSGAGTGDGTMAGCRKRGATSATIADVAMDPATSTVVVPAGLGLDPGGIGKGLAADLVVTELLAGGTGGALVSVGGDLAAAGTPPTADGWHVAVEDPFDSSRALMTLALGAGGAATSSTLKRTWIQDGSRRHHVIDPVTQTCAATDLAAVTVIAKAGWEAEVHATAALLSGAGRALHYLEDHGLEGIATTLGGTTSMTLAVERARATEGSVA